MGDIDATAVVKRARDAFRAGKTKSIESRRKLLHDMLRMVTEKEQDFVDAMHRDLKKPRFESVSYEIDYSKNEIINTLNNLDDWTKPQKVEKPLHMIRVPAYVQHQPYGVLLIIGAWNYPHQLTIQPLIGAIAAGNTVIIKPSEIAHEYATLLAKIIPQYFDNDCVQVVNGGVSLTTNLLKEKFDHILYTGSSGVGKIVMRAAADHLTPVTLELGGKSPCFIDDNVDVSVVAHRLIWAKMMNAGQTCIAPDYVLCHRSMNEKLLSAIAQTIKEFYGEDPKTSPDLGRIINDRHFQRVLGLTKCGRIAVGGDSDASQRYIAPTVLVDVKETDSVMQDEIFGPVLPIFNIDDVDEAIEVINSKAKPLGLYVFSRSKDVIRRFTEETTSGGLVTNDCLLQASIETLPFGGVGGSGMGAYHGRFSFDTFSHKRSCVNGNPGLEKLFSMRYPPFSERKMNLMQWLLNKKLKNRFLSFTFKLSLLAALAGVLFMILDNFNKR
ncbi:aldehyde dehydrogenase family 3 member B1-like [Asterias rubens]|uniref:aldehyde dehydrogenase family 3 member B1-like n=1 Tax=Asterias rubens TaxID=7604 RepID=UPI0014552D32|nr:aldehyde dehydrogenase family 3 member B1-like [Asterias rubens]